MASAKLSVRYSARVSLSADGEIRIQSKPVTGSRVPKNTAGFLDYKRKLQDGPTKEAARAGWGALGATKKFGSRAKRTLREFGGACDEFYGKKSVFLTLTLPSTDPRAFRTLAENTGYICNRLTQWIRDNIGDCIYAWVWEFQKRGALHLHMVVASVRDTDLDFLVANWKGQVVDLLQQVEARTQCDLFTNIETGVCHRDGHNVQADAQRTVKSAARYLAKYMGKHSSKSQDGEWHGPSAWWRVSNKGLVLIRRLRESFVVSSKEELHQDSAVMRLLRQTLIPKVKVFHYPNACLTFLDNWVVFSESRDAAKTLFHSLLMVAGSCAESQLEYGIANGGGGSTSPRTGCGDARMLTGSDIFTLMNSTRSTNLSTA